MIYFKLKYIKLLSILLFIFAFNTNYAQKAVLQTNKIIIGEQITLSLTINSNAGETIIFPEFDDEIISGIEIIEKFGVNKLPTKNIIEQKFTITAWKDTLFNIQPFIFIVDKDTFKTNPLQLKVSYLTPDSSFIAKIDTSQLIKIADIKSPEDTPLTFKEFWQRFGIYIIIWLIVIVVAIGAYYVYKRIKQNKPIFSAPKPVIPADIWANEKLLELRASNLIEENKIKKYYSELISIIKIYIEKRYKISAPELTSTELLKTFKHNKIISKEEHKALRRILSFADYAKFAKVKHNINENDKNLELAFSFVEKTKKIVIEDNEIIEKTEQEKI